MRRREFLSLFTSVAATWPLMVHAQSQSNDVRRIGMLFGLTENDELGRSYVNAFRERLRELGWIERGNIHIEYRWGADDPTRIRAYGAELVKLKPAVIVCQSGLTLPALQRETRSIPIVFTVITDPLASGYVTSLAHPGGNITGFANSQVGTEGKLLQILKEIAPGIDRTSVILNSEQAAQIAMLRAIQAAASGLGVPVVPIDVRNSTDFSEVIEKVAQTASSGLIVLPNPIVNRHRDLIITMSARYQVPTAYRYRYFVAAGGLVSYGERLEDEFRGAASYVDRILKGEKPGDLPIEQPTKLELVINLKTAKALGLKIPDKLLFTADEVID